MALHQASELDKSILRRLAERKAEIAAAPVHQQTADQWRRLNALQRGKPMVWINEICWSEFHEDELQCRIEAPFLRHVEQSLRQTIYQWEHLPVDMVVEPGFYCPGAINDSGFGIQNSADIVRTDPDSDIVSRRFHAQIQSEKDLDKIQVPVISHDEAESQRRYELLTGIFGDLLRIEMRGVPGAWFAPWDALIQWWGVQEAMTDLAMRPELIHQAMDRLVNATLARLDQWERLNLLSPNNNNVRVGSGGPGFSDELPAKDFNPARVRPCDLWGCATAQIFSDVSPEMHEEFALRYERRWLERFGLTYYGCCEPLHLKLGVLRSVANLRKVSMSPWANLEMAVAQAGGRYVFSHKPNPAVLAADVWNVEQARRNLREALEKMRGCVVEVILKDISTVRFEPRRLWEWARMASDLTSEYA